MNAFTLPGFNLGAFVHATLAEDLGEGLPGGGHDVTAESVIPADARFAGVMDSREAITVAGLPLAAAFFRHLDPACTIKMLVQDGQSVTPGTALMRIAGNARTLLTAERSALNTVQHLSGIATMTRAYVDAMNGHATLLDTRKTIPGLRVLEKYATRMGGATNYRMGLWDAVLIKDNHVAVAGGVGPAVARAKAAGVERIICEVDRLDQIEPAIVAGATQILLDNMSQAMLAEAVTLVAGRAATEASGGVRLDTIAAIAASGVDYVSVGRLMQSAPAVDIGLDFELV
ncbi:carboxylating nicotinate-nucleotide diphosphorylase [Collimonas pratensis]|uniref:nicotinate-nucleotide diphosphorylase (carboxylating) n=1 Tax=Collimonas pratensis TaxID=279113 RepID=A0ABM5Z7Y8_9BURK|nr:carboxylating nicotinate-nucleotide diphosphorylase [Collimonas pratensis]AMP14958.1 nicotinate-nucleotide diphosphorylase [Collimonas pratensis]